MYWNKFVFLRVFVYEKNGFMKSTSILISHCYIMSIDIGIQSFISQIVFTRHRGLMLSPIIYWQCMLLIVFFWENLQHLLFYVIDFDIGPSFLHLESTANVKESSHRVCGQCVLHFFRLYDSSYNKIVFEVSLNI